MSWNVADPVDAGLSNQVAAVEVTSALALLAAIPPSDPPRMRVRRDASGYVWLRGAWDADTYDWFLQLEMNRSAYNGGFNLLDNGRVSRSLPAGTNPGGAYAYNTFWASNDDTFGYPTAARGRIGGNHGLELPRITLAGHGLTSADVGKRYTDSAGDKFAIAQVHSTSVFDLVPEPKTIVLDTGGTRFLPATGTLTSLDGGANLTGWTKEYAGVGVVPNGPLGARNVRQQWLVDGIPLEDGMVIEAARLDIIETVWAPDPSAAYAYFTTHVGTGTWAAFSDRCWDRETRWTFRPAATGLGWALEGEDRITLRSSRPVRLNNAAGFQYNPLTFTPATDRWLIIPGINPRTMAGTWDGVASPTVDLNVPCHWQSNSADNDILHSETRIAGVPPTWAVQLRNSSAVNADNWVVAHGAGFDPTWGDGTPARRAALVPGTSAVAMQIASSTKMYPRSDESTALIAAGTMKEKRFWRLWHPPLSGSTGSFYWSIVQHGRLGQRPYWLLHCWWTTNPGTFSMTLPSWLAGRRIALAQTALNGSLVSTTVPASGAVIIASTGTNGHVILRLD